MPTPKTFEEAIPLFDKITAALEHNVTVGKGLPNWSLNRSDKGFFVSSWGMHTRDDSAREAKPTPLEAAIDFIDDSRTRIEKRIAGLAAHATVTLEESAALARLLKE